MSKESVYIETSLVSYLVAKPSRDLITAARQQLTIEWWENQRQNFDLFASPVVIEEARAGDPNPAVKRLEYLDKLTILSVTPEADELAQALIQKHALPGKAAQDALHIAVATIHGMNYLLTWNCKHIANAHLRGAIETTCRLAGYEAPKLCTPEELSYQEKEE